MLDTVILEIENATAFIVDYSKFKTTKEKISNAIGFCRWPNNPTTEDKKRGIYKPRLTLIKRGYKFYLKMEFSVPKLLFGNNLDEVSESDFMKIISILQERIKEMGAKVFKIKLMNAKVSSFHPSKNILLTGGYTSTFAIKELSKVNLNGHLDLNQTDFRNNGQSLQFYSNAHSFVLYDKISDLNKPKKRAIDKDQTIQQLSLFDDIKKDKKQAEVLRMEVRLSGKRKMNKMLKEVGCSIDPLFKDIFKKDLCQKMVNMYWNKFFSGNLFLFDMNNNPQKILQRILLDNPKIKVKRAIYLTGLNLLSKDEEGVRGIRSTVKSYRPKMEWSRIGIDLKKFENYGTKPNRYGFIDDIEENLKEFGAFKAKKDKESYQLDL